MGRAHILVGAALLGLPVGSVYAWSVFVKPYVSARPDWEASAPVHAFSIFIIFLGASSAVVGKALGRFGARACGVFGALMDGCGLGLMGAAAYWDVLLLLYVGSVLLGIGLGTTYVSFIFSLRKWFSDRPGFASGYAMMSGSSGSFIFAVVNEHVLGALHPRFGVGTPETVALGMAIYGAMVLGLQLTGALLLTAPPKPEAVSAKLAPPAKPIVLSSGEVLRSSQFWLLWTVFVIWLTGMLGVLSILAALLQGVWGESRSSAAWLVAAINLCGTFMRLWAGVGADYVGTRALSLTAFGLQVLSFVLLATAVRHNLFALALPCLIVTKIAFGAGFTLVNMLVSETFGKANASHVFGFMVSGLTVAGFLGPTVLKSMLDHADVPSLGRYSPLSLYCYIMAGAMVVGAVCMWFTSPHPAANPEAKRLLDERAARRGGAGRPLLRGTSNSSELEFGGATSSGGRGQVDVASTSRV